MRNAPPTSTQIGAGKESGRSLAERKTADRFQVNRGRTTNYLERLSLKEAIHAFTAVPAWVSRRETSLGSLAPGKIADLTVFAEDLFALTPDRLASAAVEMTIVGGEVAYRI
jgi:predicted amidohydrolase YtcJ